MKNSFAWAAWINRWAKVPIAGVGLKSYLSSGKSSAIAISLRPMSFHCSSTACDALGAGFGAEPSFVMSCACAGVIEILAAKISAASELMLFIFNGFIGNSSCHCQRRMLQEFGQHENHRFGVARHRRTSKLSVPDKP